MSTYSIVWFRNDLRVHDHKPLTRAVMAGYPVIALYIFDPYEYRDLSYGFKKTGRHRAQFIQESLEDLRTNLAELNVPLVIRYKDPVDAFLELSDYLTINGVYLHEEIATEEQQTERGVRKALPGVPFYVDHGHNLFPPEDLPFSIKDVPDTFSQFRKRIEKIGMMPPQALAPPQTAVKAELPNKLEEGKIRGAAVSGREVQREEARYRGGSTAAKRRLRDYIFTKDRLRIYKETRNGMLLEDDSSKFSPYLANGNLSPRVVYEQIQHYERAYTKNESTYMLYFELLWRDYFHLVHRKYGDRFFYKTGLTGLEIPWKTSDEHLQAWMDGRTGYPLVDAGMRELKQTGFMSNRARQNVASFFTKNLGLDWRIGAAWFESQLVDYDVSSNYGNWLYTAGVGNDAVSFRAFNVEKQAEDYDPDGDYLRCWLPELRELPVPWIFKPREMGMIEQEQYGVHLGEDYPFPIIDLYESMREMKTAFEEASK
ncbi:DASH family cryptochrome [Halobacillus litoralis]|uniref:DASH family cryptochrome n=1 Tax=Halobacillus litoralis TaxID=45668 RepID=UPI00136A8ADA|nr:DASH family cryptochrome [Halobacillus litoralis]MYL36854.1 DASH family cryptochrome [Halobacillus litoralis]